MNSINAQALQHQVIILISAVKKENWMETRQETCRTLNFLEEYFHLKRNLQEILVWFGNKLLVEPTTHNPHNIIPMGKLVEMDELVECAWCRKVLKLQSLILPVSVYKF